jgi:putative membrane protein
MRTYLKKFATSIYFDILGVILVISIAIASGYLGTRLDKFVDWGPITPYIPLGLISVINVGISMLSTRFTGKLKKSGNYLGIINTVLSGTIDFILGNKAAIITYPITFIIYTIAIKKWSESRDGLPNTLSKPRKQLIGLITTFVAIIFSAVVNFIGFGGQVTWLSALTTIVFAFSLVANIFNALKIDTQWSFWFVYNIIQLFKALVQGNFANVGKYIFYIANALGALFVWKDVVDENVK